MPIKLNNLYLCEYDGKKDIFIEKDNNYYDIFNKIKKVKVLEPLKDITLIKSLLLNYDGSNKTYLNIDEINNIRKCLKIYYSLTQQEKEKIKKLCRIITDITADLLGLNVYCNRNSKFKFDKKIIEVITPGIKLKKFKEELFNYLLPELLLTKKIVITNSLENLDYRVKKALNSSIKITKSILENSFKLELDENGNIIIDEIIKPNIHKKSLTYI